MANSNNITMPKIPATFDIGGGWFVNLADDGMTVYNSETAIRLSPVQVAKLHRIFNGGKA